MTTVAAAAIALAIVGAGEAQAPAAGAHTMDGKVTKVDAKKGWVDVKTPERVDEVALPAPRPRQCEDRRQCDRGARDERVGKFRQPPRRLRRRPSKGGPDGNGSFGSFDDRDVLGPGVRGARLRVRDEPRVHGQGREPAHVR